MAATVKTTETTEKATATDGVEEMGGVGGETRSMWVVAGDGAGRNGEGVGS